MKKFDRVLEPTDKIRVGNIDVDTSNLEPNSLYYVISYFNPEEQLMALKIELLKNLDLVDKKTYPINRLAGAIRTNELGYPIRFSCNINQA